MIVEVRMRYDRFNESEKHTLKLTAHWDAFWELYFKQQNSGDMLKRSLEAAGHSITALQAKIKEVIIDAANADESYAIIDEGIIEGHNQREVFNTTLWTFIQSCLSNNVRIGYGIWKDTGKEFWVVPIKGSLPTPENSFIVDIEPHGEIRPEIPFIYTKLFLSRKKVKLRWFEKLLKFFWYSYCAWLVFRFAEILMER